MLAAIIKDPNYVAPQVSSADQAAEAVRALKLGAVDYLTKKIKAGGAGVWGRVPMPAYPQLSDADSKAMATYILGVK